MPKLGDNKINTTFHTPDSVAWCKMVFPARSRNLQSALYVSIRAFRMSSCPLSAARIVGVFPLGFNPNKQKNQVTRGQKYRRGREGWGFQLPTVFFFQIS